MSAINHTGIRIFREDFLRLPPDMRTMGDGPMVATVIKGRKTWVRAIIVGYDN